ncbi:MAG: hypothetical protein KAS92_01675 [Candidatus Omnitrophica bacterium]|nr:hypothetical protein [Candidatus Omnitrophota bacterium]MCK5179201.1 hypothetical protein [Candidatus Omnitrophota bacterium]
MGDVLGFIVFLMISIAVALLVFRLFRGSLKSLLDEVVNIPAVTIFYVRTFLISLVFIVLSPALQITFKKDAKFMEYVWEVADSLAVIFNYTVFFLITYLVLITILISVLRHKSD